MTQLGLYTADPETEADNFVYKVGDPEGGPVKEKKGQ